MLKYKESIKELLSDISKLRPSVGPVEMCCQWFDDFYLPCRNSEGFSSDVWEKCLKEWKSCFNETELKLLAKFHELFENVCGDLPLDPLEFANDVKWQALSKEASRTLKKIGK